jgi:diacylglycerol kinase family enzyme
MKNLLLLVNRRAGSGHGTDALDALRIKAEELFSGDFQVNFHAAQTHLEIERAAEEFAARTKEASVIIAGGGGGTLGAVINGVCAAGRE